MPSQLIWLSSGFFRNRQTLVILSATSSLLNWLWVVSLFLLFSFQGSVCAAFSATSNILSLFYFSVKFFFLNIFFSERRSCLSSFDNEWHFIRKLIACQELFLFFLCCFLCVSAANNMLPHRFRSVNNYFQFFWNFFAVFRQRSIYYHRLLVLSTLFSYFFIFLYPQLFAFSYDFSLNKIWEAKQVRLF